MVINHATVAAGAMVFMDAVRLFFTRRFSFVHSISVTLNGAAINIAKGSKNNNRHIAGAKTIAVVRINAETTCGKYHSKCNNKG